MIELPDFSALILDMDGLLLDTEKTYIAAWKQAAAIQGYSLDDEFGESLTGLHYQAVEQQLMTYCSGRLNLEEFRLASGRLWRQCVSRYGIALRPGFQELLQIVQSRDIPYCLATNSLGSNANECLQYAGVQELFPLVVSKDLVNRGKPAPDIFLKAVEVLGVEKSACLIVEDSKTGIEAAKNAGIYRILIPSILPVDTKTAENADLILDNLAVLAQLIDTRKN